MTTGIQRFLCLGGDDNNLTLVNLAQVRTVQFVEGACQLVFEPSHVVNVGREGRN